MTSLTSSATLEERLCSVRASGARQDPIGTGGSVGRLLAVEMATPWSESFRQPDPAGTIAQQIWAVRTDWADALRASGDFERVFASAVPSVYGIVPDPEWSPPGLRRALLITRPDGPFSTFEITEYAFPVDSLRIVDLVRAVLAAPEEIGAFEAYRVEHGGHREVFVCTHGQVDICCAKFGVPLYRRARGHPGVRAWRMTHFGGHRFAPTAWEFPSGYKWAFLDDDATRRVLERDGYPVDLRMHVRGWSGVPARAQALDREGLDRFGWDWLDYRREGTVLEADPEARRWRVRLDFESPAGVRGRYEGVVTVARDLHEPGCGPHFGEHDFEVAEYQLEAFEEHR